MKKRNFYNSCVVLMLAIAGILSIYSTAEPPAIRSGYWRATIDRPDGQQIVFNFESKDSAGKKIIYVINAGERLLVDSIERKLDSVFIEMPFFESGFRAKVLANGNLEGVWVKSFGKIIQQLPFRAVYNDKKRFDVLSPAVANISGRWAANFVNRNNKVAELVGEFKQVGSHLTGTFLDPTGDYRFLEGVVSGDSLKLSGFDGGHAFLFTAKIENKNTISGGKFYSGARGIQDWSAEKNDKAALSDGFNDNILIPGAKKLDFSFQDVADGHLVSINDPQFKGKVLVLQIMGSWCPNCMDETKFLSDYYKKNRDRGLEVIGLAYERTTDFKSSQKALQSFIKRFNVQYPVLVTGVTVSDSLRAEKTLPQLRKIDAFPTTIFVDRNGNIKKVHSGFSGPATGKHYVDFEKEFDEIINSLLAEN